MSTNRLASTEVSVSDSVRAAKVPKCDQCEQLRINGVVCHEIGCPNTGRTWSALRERWIKYVACFECGCDVEVGESCDCQDWEGDDERDDYGMGPEFGAI